MTKKELETKVDELTASVAALTELVNSEANHATVRFSSVCNTLARQGKRIDRISIEIIANPRANTVKLENDILEVIKDHPGGMHVRDIHAAILQDNPDILYTKIANRIARMHRKRKILVWIRKGVYGYKISHKP